MAEINLRFVTEDDIVSCAIRQVTWSPFSHVEFITGPNECIGAHHAGGVARRPLDYAKFTAEERYAVSLTDEQRQIGMKWLNEQVGKPYDTTAIFGILAHRDWREDDSWDCSEMFTRFFEVAGAPILHAGVPINRITPRDVYLSPLLVRA